MPWWRYGKFRASFWLIAIYVRILTAIRTSMRMFYRYLETLLLAAAYIAKSSLGVSPFGPELETVLTNPCRYCGINFSINHEQFLKCARSYVTEGQLSTISGHSLIWVYPREASA